MKSLTHAGRVIFLSPGVSKDKLEYLQSAFDKIIQKPDFRADMEKLIRHKNVEYPDGKETTSAVKKIKAQEKIMQEKYNFLIDKYAM